MPDTSSRIPDAIEKLRKEIDVVDETIVSCLIMRSSLVRELMKEKKLTEFPIEDRKREKEILDRLKKKYPGHDQLIENIFRSIFSWAKESALHD